MIRSNPSLLRLRVLRLRPHLTLTEIQLVDTTLLYHRIDSRDRVPTEVRAMRPSAADWAELRHALDEAGFWLWPRRWPRADDRYAGEFVIAVAWDRRAAVSAGPLGVAPEVEAVLGTIGLLTSTERAVATARRAGPDRTYPPRSPSAGEAVATPQDGLSLSDPRHSRPLALTHPAIR